MSSGDPRILAGRYELSGTIGAGGMGRVHRARDRELGREVALKLVETADPTFRVRLEREARAAALTGAYPGARSPCLGARCPC